MATPTVNLQIEKGTDFDATFIVSNSDGSVFSLTNYTATSKIRKYPTSPTAKSFLTSITVETGEIRISMGSTITAELDEGRNYYDVIITRTGSGNTRKVFEGTAIVSNTVSL